MTCILITCKNKFTTYMCKFTTFKCKLLTYRRKFTTKMYKFPAYKCKFKSIYSKTSFLVQIKFITEDLRQTQTQTLINN